MNQELSQTAKHSVNKAASTESSLDYTDVPPPINQLATNLAVWLANKSGKKKIPLGKHELLHWSGLWTQRSSVHSNSLSPHPDNCRCLLLAISNSDWISKIRRLPFVGIAQLPTTVSQMKNNYDPNKEKEMGAKSTDSNNKAANFGSTGKKFRTVAFSAGLCLKLFFIGALFSSAQAEYIAIPASAFSGWDVKFFRGTGSAGRPETTGTRIRFRTHAFAPVNLPHGSKANSFTCGVKKDKAGIGKAFKVSLRRNEPQKANVDMGSIEFSRNAPNAFKYLDSGDLIESTIDNNKYNYYFAAEVLRKPDGSDGICNDFECLIGFCRIELDGSGLPSVPPPVITLPRPSPGSE